ncbi:hypothetical protein LshimejAT787_0402040 [Lyophyllum shimeji]|uniref:Uncharacterized protein n=1 Tax=Lyophyllum shimeji TaxID=47721 RepID=A0A9P3PJM0_LYOSH|nr:hypothetical protein LshimejAT787_0402040 [Lyophyllum shimeji]
MSQQSPRAGLSFFGMIGAVMTTLKLKQHWNEYNPVSTEEEGRVALSSTTPIAATAPYNGRDEATIGLLDPEARPKRKRRGGCCVCCGIDCSLFWKALGIVVAGLFVWNAIKLIRWAVADAPTGLELMPAFSNSLGCLAASHIYKGSKVVLTAGLGKENDHSFDIRGSAFGTFVIAQGDAYLKEVKYEMTLRSDDATLFDAVDIRYPDTAEDGSVPNSRLLITTPRTGPEVACMRYDIKMYVPRSLRKLHIASHTTMHLQFDSAANIEFDKLYVTMYAMDKNNLILPSQNVRGNDMTLEVFRGWIVGDVAIVNNTSITTQRGDGVANVHAYPTVPIDPEHPEPASLRTTTGAGRTDIFYVSSKASKRPINSIHMSSRNGDVYLTYRQAEFSGRVALDSKSYATTGLQRLNDVSSNEEGDGSPRWTHWAGDQDGSDEIYVRSRGWTGLYI